MNYLGYFAKGGKVSGTEIIKGIQSILGVDDNQMAELWQIGLEKYGSDEGIAEALNEATKSLTEQSSPEEVKAAVSSVFAVPQESQLFRCGGKMQQLSKKMGNGGDCGCGKKKVVERCGGKVKKHQNGSKLVSNDNTITILNPFTAQADTVGNYSYPSTNGSFKFTPEGRTANVWGNTGGLAILRYADENWMKNNPKKQKLPAILGGHRALAPQDYWDNLIQRVNNRFKNIPVPTETLVITENPEGEGNMGHIQMEKCGNKIKKHQNGHLLIGENQAGYDGTDYVTTKNEPLLGKRYIGWSRKVVPGTKELDRSDMFGGLPEGMTHRFFRSINGDTIKDTISPYGENAETANELNIAERLINNSDTLYWPNRERFNNLMKSSSTFASGRPQWILLDNERNKIK